MKIYSLSTGDTVHRYYKSIVVLFDQPRKVLSTSVENGGYREDLMAVFNNDCNPGAGMACTMKAPTYAEHLRVIAGELGLAPATSTGMATAASMENVAIVCERYEELAVTAVVTGGVEVNGGRVGDPATYYQPVDKAKLDKPGTINIILVIDADLPPGVMARALVTCTEAKTAALQELLAGSNYSTGLATGSGTDSAIIVANPQSRLYFENAGKHAKLGELIGRSVKAAVKQALERQTGLSPDSQRSVLNRLKRFGLQEEQLWQRYVELAATAAIGKPQFIDYIHQLDRQEELITYTSLYVHLLDQVSWGLLTDREMERAGNQVLQLAVQPSGAMCPVIEEQRWEGYLAAWQNGLVEIIRAQYNC